MTPPPPRWPRTPTCPSPTVESSSSDCSQITMFPDTWFFRLLSFSHSPFPASPKPSQPLRRLFPASGEKSILFTGHTQFQVQKRLIPSVFTSQDRDDGPTSEKMSRSNMLLEVIFLQARNRYAGCYNGMSERSTLAWLSRIGSGQK